MREFAFKAPNFMINRTYRVVQEEGVVTVSVASPFLGNWEFQLTSMSYEQVCASLSLYCSGSLIQDCFEALPPSLRENFMTPPSMWELPDG